MRRHIIIFSVLLLSIAGCSRRTGSLFNGDGHVKGSTSPYVPKAVYKKKIEHYTISVGDQHGEEVSLRYLGCGGFYLEYGVSAIMIDPFFSNHRFILGAAPYGVVKTKENVVKKALQPIDTAVRNKVEAVYVTHSHYDHLLDVPYIYENYLNRDKARIYTSQSGEDLLANMDAVSDAVINMQDTVVSSWYQKGVRYRHGTEEQRMVVTPLKTAHAPHFHSISLYEGEADKHRRLDETDEASWTCHWRQGQTFAFLIDIRNDNDDIALRLYVQSSAAPPKYGWLNEELLAEKEVDIAIIGAASFAYTNDYPESLVRHLQPKKILICHWEDFFLRYHRPNKRIVRGTNLRDFINRLNAVFPYATADEQERFTFTDPGTEIKITY